MRKNRLFLEDRYIAKLSRDFLEPVPTRWADDYSNTITAMYLALSRTLRAVSPASRGHSGCDAAG